MLAAKVAFSSAELSGNGDGALALDEANHGRDRIFRRDLDATCARDRPTDGLR